MICICQLIQRHPISIKSQSHVEVLSKKDETKKRSKFLVPKLELDANIQNVEDFRQMIMQKIRRECSIDGCLRQNKGNTNKTLVAKTKKKLDIAQLHNF